MLRAALFALLLASPVRAQDHDHAHPDLALRIDQAALDLPAIADAVRDAVDGKIDRFRLEIKEDGFHVTGKYKVPILPDIGFHAVASLVYTGPNVFEIRVHKLTLLGGLIDATKLVLKAVEGALKGALQDVCTFKELGARPDGSQALQVTVDTKQLMPSPTTGLYLSGISTRDQVLILKAKLP
ncbi:MAG: hypothetical protein HY925_01530 [Elusimicrobia bacterium]|nr:hypothetical protein [Elusimicrobiota bacterium]